MVEDGKLGTRTGRGPPPGCRGAATSLTSLMYRDWMLAAAHGTPMTGTKITALR